MLLTVKTSIFWLTWILSNSLESFLFNSLVFAHFFSPSFETEQTSGVISTQQTFSSQASLIQATQFSIQQCLLYWNISKFSLQVSCSKLCECLQIWAVAATAVYAAVCLHRCRFTTILFINIHLHLFKWWQLNVSPSLFEKHIRSRLVYNSAAVGYIVSRICFFYFY